MKCYTSPDLVRSRRNQNHIKRFANGVLIAFLLLTWALATNATLAQPTWNNPTGGSFHIASNWTGGVPNSTQDAFFNAIGSNRYGVNFNSPVILNRIVFGDHAIFNLGGHHHSIGSDLFVFQTNLSLLHNLTLENGTINAQTTSIGSNVSAGQASLTVGAGAILNSESIAVRNASSSTARLSVENGGQATTTSLTVNPTAGRQAVVFVDGIGSSLTVNGGTSIGVGGTGELQINQGGTLNSQGIFFIGSASSDSNGAMRIFNGTWNHAEGEIGVNALSTGPGEANLEVRGTANIFNSSLNIGANGSVEVEGPSASFNMSGSKGVEIRNGGQFLIQSEANAVIQRTGSEPAITIQTGGLLQLDRGSLTTSSLNRLGTLDLRRGTLAIEGGAFNNNGASLSLGGAGSIPEDLRFELRNGASTQNLSGLLVGTTNLTGIAREFAVLSGSTLTTTGASNIGQLGNGSSVRIDGTGSRWNSAGAINVGLATGELTIENGGQLNMGANPLATGLLGATSNGTISVRSGGQIHAGAVELARVANSNSVTTITGTNSQLTASSIVVGGTLTGSGGNAVLNLADNASVTSAGITRIRNGGTLNLDGGTFTTHGLSRDTSGVLNFNNGTLRLVGGVLSNSGAALTVSGAGVSDHASLVLDGNVLSAGVTSLTIGQGNRLGTVRLNSGSSLTTGAVTINQLGTLELNGGRLSASSLSSTGVVNWNSGRVDFAAGSTIDNSTLTGLLGTAKSLNANQTLGNISGTMTLGGSINVIGGEIQTVNLTNDSTLGIQSGLVHSSGNFLNNAGRSVVLGGTGLLNAGNLTNRGSLRLNSDLAGTSGGAMLNEEGGTIRGTGRITNSLINEGTIQALSNDYLQLAGSSVENRLNMTLSNGTIEIGNQLVNSERGAITGRGTLITRSSSPGELGLINAGVMSFSSGNTDIFGDVQNLSGGRIVTAGGGITTFFDDVLHDGSEIRTFSGSRTVFFGEQTGSGNFTGTGVVEYAGDLRPGNSPATISYGGDVVFNSTTQLFIELGGTLNSEFDRLLIAGDFTVDGLLSVELIDGHTLSANQTYLFGEVGGSLFGNFLGLGEGAFVTNLSGHDLFITYAAGNGQSLALFTAVPEPSAALLVAMGLALSVSRRRREV